MADNTGRDTEIRIMTDMPENPLNAFRYPFRKSKDLIYKSNLITNIPDHITGDPGVSLIILVAHFGSEKGKLIGSCCVDLIMVIMLIMIPGAIIEVLNVEVE